MKPMLPDETAKLIEQWEDECRTWTYHEAQDSADHMMLPVILGMVNNEIDRDIMRCAIDEIVADKVAAALKACAATREHPEL